MTVQFRPSRAVIAVMALVMASGGAFSADPSDPRDGEKAWKRWAYPNATPYKVSHSLSSGSSVLVDEGQYSTIAPFHEVVRFYVERSGLEPPNWSILGRKFPGDTVNIPGSWSKWGKTEAVTLHHHIRSDSASAGLMVTDFSGGETVSVSISRGLKDDKTFIQVTRHARE